MNPDDISQIAQPDIAPQPLDDQSLLAGLQQGQLPGAPQSPDDKLRQFLQQSAQGSSHDEVLKLLHMTPEEKSKRSTLGNVGQTAGNVLQTLLGRNFVTEGQRNYDSQTQRIAQGNQTVRNEDLASQASTIADLKQQDIDRKLAVLDQQKVRDENTRQFNSDKNDIASRIAEGKYTQSEAQAALAKVKASNLAETGGLTGENAFLHIALQKIADGTPASSEEVQNLLKMHAAYQSGNAFSKVPTTGSVTGRFTGLDANNNPITNTNRTIQRPNPMAQFQGLLGQMSTGAPAPGPAQNSLGSPIIQPPPQGQAAPQGSPMPLASGQPPQGNAGPQPQASMAAPAPSSAPPVNPITALQAASQVAAPKTELVPDGFDPSKFIDNKAALALGGGNINTFKQEQGRQAALAKTEGAKFEQKKVAVDTNNAQLTNLAQSMAQGKVDNFQGPLASLTKPVRDLFTGISPEEGKQRIEDFRAMYDNLGSSMKGAFKKQEIDQAMTMQGSTSMTPKTALILHAMNSYSQQEQMLSMGRSLQGKNGKPLVSPEELNKLVGDQITQYVNTVESKYNTAKSNPVAGALQTAPALPKLTEVINQYLTKKAVGLTPKPTDTRQQLIDKGILPPE